MMKKIKTDEIKQKIFLLSGLGLPILFEYAMPLSGFTVGDFFLLIAICFLVFTKKSLFFELPFLILLIFVVADTALITVVSFEINFSVFFRTLRFVIYLTYAALLPNCVKYKDWAVDIYKKFSLFSAFVLVIQYYMLKLFEIFLPGVLTFLPLTDNSLYDYKHAVLYTNSGRCMSIFGEPSHYSIYVLPCVLLFLYAYDVCKKRRVLYGAFFISASVFLCASFAGVIGLMFVWLMWAYNNLKKGKVSQRMFIIVLILTVACVYSLTFTRSGAYLTNADVYFSQSSGRLEGFAYIWNLFKTSSVFDILFGYGMNDIAQLVYLSGWPRLLFYFGIIGIIVYVSSFIHVIKRHGIGCDIVYLLMILMIGSELNFGPFFIPYIILILLLQKERIKNK